MFNSPVLAAIFFGLIITVFIYKILVDFSYVKLTLAVILAFIVKLIVVGELPLLIHPRYFWLAKAAVMVIFVMLILDKKEKEKIPKVRYVLLSVLNILLVFSLFTKFKPLSSNAQGSISLNSSVGQLNRNKRLTNFRTNTDNLTLEDWLTMFSIDPEPSRYVGKKIKVTGFYYVDNDGNPALGKYIISCCIADARIMGIWLTKELNYEPDTWLNLEGTLKEIEIDGQRNVAIEVTKQEETEAPKDPYATK